MAPPYWQSEKTPLEREEEKRQNTYPQAYGEQGTALGGKQGETVVQPPTEAKIFIDMNWLNNTLDELKYQRAIKTKIKSLFPAVVIKDKNLVEILEQLTHDQQDKLVKDLRERAEWGGIDLE